MRYTGVCVISRGRYIEVLLYFHKKYCYTLTMISLSNLSDVTALNAFVLSFSVESTSDAERGGMLRYDTPVTIGSLRGLEPVSFF